MKNNNSTAIATISTLSNLDQADALNQIALHQAALNGNIEVRDHLIAKEEEVASTNVLSSAGDVFPNKFEKALFNLEKADALNQIALHQAALNGNIEVRDHLIAKEEEVASTNVLSSTGDVFPNKFEKALFNLEKADALNQIALFQLALDGNIEVRDYLIAKEEEGVEENPILTMAMKHLMGKLQHKVTTSSDISTDDHNEVERESSEEEVASTNVVSSTGDVFKKIIGGVENLIIEDTDVLVMGDFGTEG
jgi:hypothetical protein